MTQANFSVSILFDQVGEGLEVIWPEKRIEEILTTNQDLGHVAFPRWHSFKGKNQINF